MIRIRKSKIIIITALIAGLLAVGGGVLWYQNQTSYDIRDYNMEKDRPFIMTLFDKDWYWLSGYRREDSNPDTFLVHRSPFPDPYWYGKLIIKVMYEKNNPVGFVAYFVQSFYEGKILFIDVAPQARRKKYGRILLDYGIDDLKKQGVSVVRLTTRPQNIPAQALYKKAGFKEHARDATYVHFEKQLR